MIVPRRRKRDSFLPWIQLAVDVASTYGLLYLTFWIRFGSHYFESSLGSPDYFFYHRSFLFVTLVIVFFLRSNGLYRSARIYTFLGECAKVTRAVLMGTVLIMSLTFFYRGFSFSRLYLVIAGVVLSAGLSGARVLLGLLVMAIDHARKSYRNILVIGCDEASQKIAQYYRRNPRFATRVVGFLDDHLATGTTVDGAAILGKTSELERALAEHPYIHEVVLSGQGHSNEAVLRMIYVCEKTMVQFRWIADIFGLIASKMSVSYLGQVPLLSFVDSPLAEWENRAAKRAVDILLSATGLVFTALIFPFIAIAVKRSSPGPVLYKQERIGQDGEIFTLYKFRTMRVDAEAQTGPVWAQESDPRRTAIGRFLRENNLDELPQLFNVLKGDMSLVGPRPERPHFVTRFKEDIPRYMARHSIKSGITGWAQVNGLRGNTSIEERTKFDLYYIENWSLLLDFQILFMTFLAKRNAY